MDEVFTRDQLGGRDHQSLASDQEKLDRHAVEPFAVDRGGQDRRYGAVAPFRPSGVADGLALDQKRVDTLRVRFVHLSVLAALRAASRYVAGQIVPAA